MNSSFLQNIPFVVDNDQASLLIAKLNMLEKRQCEIINKMENFYKSTIDYIAVSLKTLTNVGLSSGRAIRRQQTSTGEDYADDTGHNDAHDVSEQPAELAGLNPEQPITSIEELQLLHAKLENAIVKNFYVRIC